MNKLLIIGIFAMTLTACNSGEIEKLKVENAELRLIADKNAQEAERQALIAEEQAAIAKYEKNSADLARFEAEEALEKCKNGK